jgi:rhodanese-related sulfurtransferase
MAEIKNLTTEDLKSRLNKGEEFYFWNVSTDGHFHGEIIPGSHRISLYPIGREVSTMNVPKTSEIVVYSTGPKSSLSLMAARKLHKLGYPNVSIYEGGLEEWKSAGYEVTDPEK